MATISPSPAHLALGLLTIAVGLRIVSKLGPAPAVLGLLGFALSRARGRAPSEPREQAASQAPSSPSAEMAPSA